MVRVIFNERTFKMVISIISMLSLISVVFIVANSEYNYVGEMFTDDEDVDEYVEEYDREEHQPDGKVLVIDTGFNEYGSVWVIPEASFRIPEFWGDDYWEFTVWEEKRMNMTVSIPYVSIDFNFDAFGQGDGILPDFFEDLRNLQEFMGDAPLPVVIVLWTFFSLVMAGLIMVIITAADISI